MAFNVEPDAKGLYGVCVYQGETIEDDQIQELFGEFGLIANHHRTNNFLFVRYQEKDHAERCLKAYSNNPNIRVNPARKRGKNNDSRNQDSFDRSPRDNTMNRSRDDNRSSHSSGFQDGNKLLSGQKLIPINNDDENETKELPVEKAKVVIISNIANGVLPCQVYDMCTKAGAPPLAVQMESLKKPGYRTINYAKVFLKSDEEVQNVVVGLDNLDINSRKLTVKPWEHYQKSTL